MRTRIAYVLMIAMAMIAPVAWAAPAKKAKTLNEGLTNTVDKYIAIHVPLADDTVDKLPAAAKDLSAAAKETAKLKGASKDLQALLGKIDSLAVKIGGKDVKIDDARATFKDLSAAVVELVTKYVWRDCLFWCFLRGGKSRCWYPSKYQSWNWLIYKCCHNT